MIKDYSDCFHPIRALLDSCSEFKFITEEAAKRLKLKWEYSHQEVSGIADVRTTISKHVTATVRSRISEFEWTSTFAVSNCISSKQPSDFVAIHDWKIPNDIDLADPEFCKPQHIDLLIGTEIFFGLLRSGTFSLGPDLPSLVNSTFRWIVGGTFHQKEISRTFTCNVALKSSENNLEALVRTFWEIEDF